MHRHKKIKGTKRQKVEKHQINNNSSLAYFNFIILLLVILFLFSPPAQAASPQVHVSIDTTQSYWAGQKIPLYIDLLSPSFFSGTPKFELPEISSVLVMKIPGRPVMGVEEIEGLSYTKQRHEFVLFSQRPGRVDIPSFTVKFGVSGQAGALPKEVALKTSPLTLTPKMPPGAEKLATIISTQDLKVTEKWNPEPKDAVTGDAFTRTVTFQAPDIPGMALLPMPELQIPGIAIYAEAPVVNDQIERGDFVGERTETISYVMETAGQRIIPAIEFQWFDIESKSLKTEQLPEVKFMITPSAGEQSSKTSAGVKSFKMLYVLGIVFVFIAGAVLGRWRKNLMMYFQSWQKYQSESESAYFKRFIRACRKDDPKAALNAMMKWVDRVNPNRQTALLKQFTETWGESELASEVAVLQKYSFYQEKESGSGKTNKAWSGKKLSQQMIKARERLNKSRYEQKAMTEDLMPLNPL